jgi:hypothetical protein
MLELPVFVALLVAAETGLEARNAVDGAIGCSTLRAGPPVVGDVIGLASDGPGSTRLIEEALAAWRSCANYAADFPRLLVVDSAAPQGKTPIPTSLLQVRLIPGNSGNQRCGIFRGRTIVLYVSALTSSGEVRSCGSMALNLAHELGHALGLGDSDDVAACDGTIMADLSSRNIFRRAVSAEECRLAGRRWLTFAELRPPAPRRPAPAAAPAWVRGALGSSAEL